MPTEEVKLRYSIETPVNVDGITLSAGTYEGKRIRIGVHSFGGKIAWDEWEFRIDPPGFDDLVCTQQVTDGRIKVVT